MAFPVVAGGDRFRNGIAREQHGLSVDPCLGSEPAASRTPHSKSLERRVKGKKSPLAASRGRSHGQASFGPFKEKPDPALLNPRMVEYRPRITDLLAVDRMAHRES